LWQCRQNKNLSIRKKVIIPKIKKLKTLELEFVSRHSGRICRKALPMSAPAEKPIRQKRIFGIKLAFIKSVIIPTREITLTRKVLARIQIKTMLLKI
jgi:hypothetical protein